AVAERPSLEPRAEALREGERGELDDPAMRHGEHALAIAHALRDPRPRLQLLRGERARVLALAKDAAPVRERVHLAEDAVADDAAHLGKEPGVDRVEPAGDELRGLLRSREGTREDQGELWRALSKRHGHRPARFGERALVVLRVRAFRVAADLDEGHRRDISPPRERGRLVVRRPLLRLSGSAWPCRVLVCSRYPRDRG